MKPPTHLLVVQAEVDADVETAWNQWYDDKHLPEIAQCPGFDWGSRYVSEDEEGNRSYLTVYGMQGPQAVETKAFQERRGWAQFSGKVKYQSRIYALRSAVDGTAPNEGGEQ